MSRLPSPVEFENIAGYLTGRTITKADTDEFGNPLLALDNGATVLIVGGYGGDILFTVSGPPDPARADATAQLGLAREDARSAQFRF